MVKSTSSTVARIAVSSALYITVSLIFCFHLIASSAAATTTITLQNALLEAEGNNPELKRLKYKAEEAHWDKLKAISNHLPHISANATQFFDAKYSRMTIYFPPINADMPQAFPQTTMTLEASLDVFDGLATYNNYRASIYAAQAADLEYQRANFKLSEEVRMKFWQALAAKDLARVADENIKTLNDHLKLVKASRHAGVSTNYDVLRIESELEVAQAQKLLADDTEDDSRRTLLDLLGVDESDMAVDGTLPVPDVSRVPKNLRLDLTKRQDVEAQTKMELAAGRRNAAAKGAWLPRVDLFADKQFYHFGSFDSAVIDSPGYKDAYSYGMRLTWNLFDGGRSIADQQIIRDQYEESKAASRRSTLNSISEFERWKRRFFYNCALYEARQRTVDKSQESVRLATIAVKAGVKTNTEALDAELELFRARADVIRSQVDAAEALANLELAVGHPL